MYGLEKKPGEKFAFDLEKDIQEDSKLKETILEKVESKTKKIKESLQKGQDEKEFENLGILLHGYTALQKVIRKIAK